MAELLDPNSIVVQHRQRGELGDLSSLETSIKEIGQIQPIVVRRENDLVVLMVGGRRLKACANLGIAVRAEFWEDLDPISAKIIELEENIRRDDISWRDRAKATDEIHRLFKLTEPDWTLQKTAKRLGETPTWISRILTVFKNLDSPLLTNSTGIDNAFSILQTAAERRAASIVNDIIQAGTNIFKQEPEKELVNVPMGDNPVIELDKPDRPDNDPSPINIQTSPQPIQVILNIDFTKWILEYTGPKFNLIHCDFPFDVKYDSYAKSVTSNKTEDYDFSGFWPLLDCLCDNLNTICSYSAHIMFWFSMKFYSETKSRLERAGLYVHDHPLVWHKTDNSGIIPGRDNAFPRRTYETAFLCSRGKRPLIRSQSNIYGAPMASGSLHPSQKPEPVLNHFLSMLIDETTDFLDPTCGSGTAIRSAEYCGARSVLGLELDPNYAASAEAATQNARRLRGLKL
jgi:ParB/RepB/Spo0J family partition protein